MSIIHRLIRTKTGTGADTIYADGATVPDDAGEWDFSPVSPDNKGPNTHVEVCAVAVNASGTVQARAGTFTFRFTEVVSRSADAREQADGSSWADFAADSATVTGVELQQWVRVPKNGGKVFVGMETISGTPGSATGFQIWAKSVSE